MFEITDNNFLNKGTCKYRDSYGNRAYFERDKHGFTAKLRFVDKRVKMEPLTIIFPLSKDTKGAEVKIEYSDGVDKESEFILAGIRDFGILVQRWINMVGDISYLAADIDTLVYLHNVKISDDDVSRHKIATISKYEELKPTIEAVFL